MEYVEVEQARSLPGLRLVLTEGVPNVWGEAAKGIFRIKGIGYVAVRHRGGQLNQALLDWTRQNSGPVAVYEDERPRSGWAEILFLAERLNPRPALVPADPGERATMFGLAHEICGEQGLGWTRRLAMAAMAGPDRSRDSMAWKYGMVDEAAVAAAPARVAAIVDLLAGRLHAQRKAGSRWFVGGALTAVDVYWATFSNLLAPLPPEHSPMPGWLRRMSEARRMELDPILIEHRDHMFAQYLGLPQDF